MKNIKAILKMQSKLERTHLGRNLSEKAIEIVANEFDESLEVNECNTCGFIFTEDHFSGGCISCGSQDYGKNIENK